MAKRFGRVVLAFLIAACLFQPIFLNGSQGTAARQLTLASATSNKAALRQALLDLVNPWTVMCVAAHPDDEDGTTLTVLRRKYGVHTVTLFSTYGEGGQNAIGPELYEELGVIREAETRRASAIQGSEPHFLGLRDFGFSKSAEETLRFWNHDEALRRMVLKIRELQPDAIITNHDPTSGHGHHQATGRLVLEAFDAAADPQKFPEQLDVVRVWQVKRLFVRARRTTDSTAEQTVVIDPNENDPARGTTFGEQALAALQQHASQGPWPKSVSEWLRAQNSETGKLNPIRYRFVKQAAQPVNVPGAYVPFVSGLMPSMLVAPPDVGGRQLTDPALEPTEVLSTLIRWAKEFTGDFTGSKFQEGVEPAIRARLDRALAAAAAVSLTISAKGSLVPGHKTLVTVSLTNAGANIFRVHGLTLNAFDKNQQLKAAEHLLADTETTATVEVTTPTTAAVNVPKAKHLYDGLLPGKRIQVWADLELDNNARFKVTAEGNLDVAPPVEIVSVSPAPIVRAPATLNQPIKLKIDLKNHTGTVFDGIVKLASPQFRIFQFGKQISISAYETQTVALEASATMAAYARRRNTSGPTMISVEGSNSNGALVEEEIQVIVTDALVRPNLRVGYVPSFDNSLETALTALHVESKRLTMAEVRESDLNIYDTIIIDNRGYEAHPELVTNNAHLLQFVEKGGTLLVFYHKDNEWNPNPRRSRPQLAPLPIVLGGERVTQEDAPIRFRIPSHPLMNVPNRISQADFRDWIQERGLYYPRQWDLAYEMLFATNDIGEKPLYGGLLVTKHGKGNYIYTSMVWYRQLRAGHAGAYKMFANMISYANR